MQNQLGADIIMAFDDCPPSSDPTAHEFIDPRLREAVKRDTKRRPTTTSARLAAANERTITWLERCKAAHRRPHEQALVRDHPGRDRPRSEIAMRRAGDQCRPARATPSAGWRWGSRSRPRSPVVDHTAALMPEDKPRYLMGVGYERDLLAGVLAGIDMFDCVLPTRNGRNANAFTRTGQIRLRNARFAEDSGPIDDGCDCPACSPASHALALPGAGPFSRAYLRHLFMAGEMLGPILVSLHNLRHFQRLMQDIRDAIPNDDWASLGARWPVAADGLARLAGG